MHQSYGLFTDLGRRVGLRVPILVFLAIGFTLSAWPLFGQAPATLDDLNVIFTTPSTNASGAVPLGNGKVGISPWFETNGDLVMYLSSPDSFSGTPNLLKLGRIRISLTPAPLGPAAKFSQVLKLREGRLEADVGKTHWEIFVEAFKPIIRIQVRGADEFTATVTNEVWRTQPTLAGGWSGFGWKESVENIVEVGAKAIASYHRNETTVTLDLLKQQSCDQLPGVFDPLKDRTFGLWLEGPGLRRINSTALETTTKELDLRIACPVFVAEKAEDWITAARNAAATAEPVATARQRTEQSWRAFWDRSWLIPETSSVSPGSGHTVVAIAQAYALQRYVTACQGKGEFPIKFNGGIFTVNPEITNPRKTGTPDFREWGDAYWYQNTRHMYHPLLRSGDFDLMTAFFRLYERARPLAEARARSWYGAEGCFFPETMTVFGAYGSNDYGRNRAGRQPGEVESAWVGRIWSQGLELVSVMCDYWEWTGDSAFAQEQLMPMAISVLRYYDTRFRRDTQGRLIIAPSQVIETYQTGVTNDVVNIAGLRSVTARLLQLPENILGADQKALITRMEKSCPDLPTMEIQQPSGKTRVLAPAQAYDNKRSNVENPELYAIWPFRLFGVGKPDLEMARATYAARKEHLDKGWGYDGNAAALLGLADEAKRIVLAKCANSHPAHRFPASWGPNYDWLPDMNHGGNLMETLELMMLQADGRKIYLLPAWPRDWDCQFKLHAPKRTVLQGEVRHGKLTRLEVFPPERREDVINCWE